MSSQPPSLLRSQLELLAGRLEAARGSWRIELIYRDGVLISVYRHEEKLAASEVDRRFDPGHSKILGAD